MATRRSPAAKSAGGIDKPKRFDEKLVLVAWMLSLFEASRFEDLADELKRPELEGVGADGITHFHRQLVQRTVERESLSDDDLLRYDGNIVRHTRALEGQRGEPLTWRYFQYLGLLFTEIYLDRLFRDATGLCDDLNRFRDGFNDRTGAGLPPYTADDLRKVAVWSATGSGKTLLMHVNLRQYWHYLREHGREQELNRTILLTPNEGLSKQHLDEFEKSGVEADLFRKDAPSLFVGRAVEILEVTKLKEEAKEKSVAVDAFESNNLVLVDEGHRGAKGTEWKPMRDRLSAKGFAFEYSATFGQVVRSASGADRARLEQEYARCILFDYSYKYFYRDGYGKEYRILNLAEDRDEPTRDLYLTACLLAFYQQGFLFDRHREGLARFNIARPLALFVGGSVNAVRKEGDREVSDVTLVLRFFADFVANAGGETVRRLERLMEYDGTLLDPNGRSVFPKGTFGPLNETGATARETYNGILRTVFNAAAPGSLHVDLLKGVDGELSLRVGTSDAFGVINVGDAASLHALCRHSGLIAGESEHRGSLFEAINRDDSRLTILIGSRKFTEGWSSWRVSTMGLLNIGRKEGSQIIQLFGRGVRLKGLGMSLKRSSALEILPKPPRELTFLETLNVFGVRSDYMTAFKEMLEEEGVPNGDRPEPFVIETRGSLPATPLKVVDVVTGKSFKQDGPKPTLGPPFPGLDRVSLDWYPRVQATQSKGAGRAPEEAYREEGVLGLDQTAFLDIDGIWFELQRFKAEKGWSNLNLPRAAVVELLKRSDWYTLYIPRAELEVRSFAQYRRFGEIATALLKKYAERFYAYKRAEWERSHLRYRDLTSDEATLENGYRIDVKDEPEETLVKLRELRSLVTSGALGDHSRDLDATRSLSLIGFSKHLFEPLLAKRKGAKIDVSPVPLNEGERDFVEDLRRYVLSGPDQLAPYEMYLLRNPSRGKGIGFFEAGGFYPDFILWLIRDGRQWVTFVDPKGIRNLDGKDDPKIRFSATIKDLQHRLDNDKVVLNSFIVSVTPYLEIGARFGMDKEGFHGRNVLFQFDDRGSYVEQLFQKILNADPKR